MSYSLRWKMQYSLQKCSPSQESNLCKAQLSYLLNKDNCLYTISGGIIYLSLTVIVLVYACCLTIFFIVVSPVLLFLYMYVPGGVVVVAVVVNSSNELRSLDWNCLYFLICYV